MSQHYNTKELSLALAKSLLDDIYYQKARYYYFLGRVNSWGVEDTPATSITISPKYLYDTRRDMTFIKRISPNEASLVVRRINWNTGVVYDQWDNTQVMHTKNFYVMTDEYKVYKCLNNNNGAASTQKPTSVDTEPVTLADSYTWKYMYTVPSFKRSRFLTLDYIPVQRSISESFYGIGEIEGATVVTGGSGYTEATTNITVIGDGTGAVIQPVIYDGAITDVVIVQPGEGYTNASLVVTSTTGTGAELAAIISRVDYSSDQLIIEQSAASQKGKIYSVVVSNQGSNYTDFTSVEVVGNGTGCVVEPVIVSGRITQILVVSEGSGYTYANIVITDPGRPIIPENEKAEAYTILPPETGHGADATKELYATTVSLATPLRADLEVQGVDQEFRTYGIIKGPKNIFTGAEYTKQSELLVYKTTFSNVDALVKDEILLFENNRFRVVEIAGLVVYLSPMDLGSVSPIGTLVAQSEAAREYTSVSSSNTIELDKYTGNLVYFSEQPPFEFTEDQSITVKTYMKF